MDHGILDMSPFHLIFKPAEPIVPELSKIPDVPIFNKSKAVTPKFLGKCSAKTFLIEEDEKKESDSTPTNPNAPNSSEVTSEKAVSWDPLASELK